MSLNGFPEWFFYQNKGDTGAAGPQGVQGIQSPKGDRGELGPVGPVNIANDLETTEEGYALDARQGKEMKDMIGQHRGRPEVYGRILASFYCVGAYKRHITLSCLWNMEITALFRTDKSKTGAVKPRVKTAAF